ncbi:ATP-binding protein [Citricoccus nitrophenolicus]|uniref:ATP-binding protein n=1 Tax=Citricoccus nitrophenolicus TaxID=863575 RepID=UPI0039B5EF6E
MNATAAAPTPTAPTAPSPAVTPVSETAAEAAIAAACRSLMLPTIREQAGPLAQAAARERLTHQGYLAEVLTAECDDRDARRRIRRVKEAKFPRTKSLADFDTTAITELPAATLAQLATGAWIDAGEPLVLLGDSGTGKTESPWESWRLLTLETRMGLCRRTSRRISRPRVGTARRRKPPQCGWCAPCALS